MVGWDEGVIVKGSQAAQTSLLHPTSKGRANSKRWLSEEVRHGLGQHPRTGKGFRISEQQALYILAWISCTKGFLHFFVPQILRV